MNADPRPTMPLMRHAIVLMGVVLALAWAPGTRAGDMEHPPHRERIADKAEIQKLLTNHTLYGRYVDGKPWIEYHSADGRTAYHENNCTYQGHWWFQEGLVCFRYEAFSNGAPSCFRMYRDGDELEFDQEYSPDEWRLNAYTLERKAGNPEKLPLEGQACVGV